MKKNILSTRSTLDGLIRLPETCGTALHMKATLPHPFISYSTDNKVQKVPFPCSRCVSIFSLNKLTAVFEPDPTSTVKSTGGLAPDMEQLIVPDKEEYLMHCSTFSHPLITVTGFRGMTVDEYHI